MTAPWTGTSEGPPSHEKSLPRTGLSGEDEEGNHAGPLQWCIRGATGRSPGLVEPGKKGSGPGLDLGCTGRGGGQRRSKAYQQRTQEQNPKNGGSTGESQPAREHLGNRGKNRGLCNTNSEEGDEDQDKGGEYGDKTDPWKRSARERRKEKMHFRKDQPEKRANFPGLAGK